MKVASFHAIADALTRANVRFILVGGLAVIAQGYLRVTRDAGIVIELAPENIFQAFEALKRIGYRPTVPITARQFSDEHLRRQWRKDKRMKFFNSGAMPTPKPSSMSSSTTRSTSKPNGRPRNVSRPARTPPKSGSPVSPH